MVNFSEEIPESPEIPARGHPENPSSGRLAKIEKMKRDASAEIYRIKSLIEQANRGVRIEEDLGELERRMAAIEKTYQTLEYDEAKIKGETAHEDDVIKKIEDQFG